MVHRRHTSRSDASSGQPGLFTRPLTAFGRDGFIGQDIYLGKPTVGQNQGRREGKIESKYYDKGVETRVKKDDNGTKKDSKFI